ncbi:MAG: glycerophosphodiester phosphodiesterase [Thermoproteota archaeon]
MKPIIVGHRGSPDVCPENTLPSFLKAIEVGVDAIEFDVRKTKDHKLIVMHDETIDRTTNGKGLVRELTLEQIERLDAGSWFSSSFKGTKVPTLQEVLEKVNSKVLMRIELKDDGIEKDVVEAVKSFGLEENVAVASFNLSPLKKVKELLPSLSTVAITANFSKSFIFHSLVHFSNTIAARFRTFTQEDVRSAHLHGLTFDVWTIDSCEALNEVLNYGVDSITTNRPKEILTCLLNKL